MRIAVCLKLIIDPDIAEFDITTDELRNTHMVLDPIGRYILEEGLTLKEKLGGEVTAVTVAPETGDTILKDALLHGADRAIRLWNEHLEDTDTWLISQVIQDGLNKIGFDVVLCGTRSGDTSGGFMVSALAHSLDCSSATGIIGLEVDNEEELVVHKRLPRGQRETYRLRLPAVLGIEEGINEPRYVAPFSRTYREGMKKKAEFSGAHIDGQKTCQRVKRLFFTQPRPRVKTGIDVSALSMQERLKMMRGELGRKKELFEGTPGEAARKIYSQLRDFLK